MNFRGFAVILTCVSGGMLLLALYGQYNGGRHSAAAAQAQSAATAPSAAPTAATAPAAVTSAASTAPVAGTTAPAAEDLKSLEDRSGTHLYTIGSLDKKTGYKFQVELTNDGASIYNIQLSEYYATIGDKRLAEKLNDEQAYLREVRNNPGKYHGHYTVQSPLAKGPQTAQELEKQLQQGMNVSVGDKLYLPLATQRVTSVLASGQPFSWRLDDAHWWTLAPQKEKDSESISFRWTVQRSGKAFLKLTKTYTVYARVKPEKGSSEYSIDVKLEAENLSGEPMTVSLEQAGPTSLLREDLRSDERKVTVGSLKANKVEVSLYSLIDPSTNPKSVKEFLADKNLSDGELRGIEAALVNGSAEEKQALMGRYFPHGLPQPQRTGSGELVYGKIGPWWQFWSPGEQWVHFCFASEATIGTGPGLGSSGPNVFNPVLWMGQGNKFFASLMYLLPAEGSGLGAVRPATQYRAFSLPIASRASGFVMPGADADREFALPDASKAFHTQADVEQLKVAPGQTGLMRFDVYTGPKDRDLFETAPLYRDLDYRDAIEIKGGCFCSFDWLTLGIMWLLEHMGKGVGNYGMAIILLVIVVRVLLHPLTKKGQVSMMKMQKLAPKMAALKEKYKDDKDALQRETMKFYKEQGATPILGCLPMLLQMPIWLALYTGLNADVALRQAGFLPVWITDLAGQDAVYHLPWAINLPLAGTLINLNLLPILLTIATYYQTKLMPTSMGASATPQQASQQKMMKYMSPAMMLVFLYNAPAGLNLYIMTSTFSSVFEQIIIRKHIQEKEAAEAAAETQVVAPGKGARGFRPKKPKGPFWTKRG